MNYYILAEDRIFNIYPLKLTYKEYKLIFRNELKYYFKLYER